MFVCVYYEKRPSSSGYNVFCVGENRIPFVFEVRKVQGKTTWMMEPCRVEYPSVAAVIEQLKAAGIARVPLGIFAPTLKKDKTQYGSVMDEVLCGSMSMTKALQLITSLFGLFYYIYIFKSFCYFVIFFFSQMKINKVIQNRNSQKILVLENSFLQQGVV